MFSGALKSFSSNITSNYTISPQPTSTAGPWRIFDAKRKGSGKAVSVFVFDKKSLDAGSGHGFSNGKSGASSLKRAHEEVVERLKREASSLARLRHPSILELAEPVEETRSGGLTFATEPVTASLASLLAQKDDGRGSKYMVEEQDGTRRRRELEIDELEIQKGLLQLGKGLEFLHESAGLVHANLTPDAIMINAKGDWKIAGLGFCGPFENSTAPTSLIPINLHEALNYDPRLPRHVQLNLDYASPDFVLDNSLVTSADMFSLGLLIISLYNKPHTSPISVGGSASAYKRAFASPSTIPTRANAFLVPSSQQLPPRLSSELLPRLITRRPAQRMNAREFQDASYFDNILVSTLRFLEALPAKTPQEKRAFLGGLKSIMSQFPSSVLEKKVLPALLEEMKDRELLALILTNVFEMIRSMPAGKRAFTEQIVPRLRDVFLTNRTAERDALKEAGLMVVLQGTPTAAANCAGKEFREDILPIIILAMESQTPSLVDAALGTLPSVLSVLDFSTIKNELFPVVAQCFSKTTSLAIKIKGLEAFYILCGGDLHATNDQQVDDLSGVAVSEPKRANSSAILDKYTVQEKIVPLMKLIKTKEPGVMMAALRVFRQVREVADPDFLAMDVLPILWNFSLGPLLSLQQFQAFMSLIKSIGDKVEREHTRKLTELGAASSAAAATAGRATVPNGTALEALSNGGETDFATLVSGRKTAPVGADLMNEWSPASIPSRPAAPPKPPSAQAAPTFSWQSSVTTPMATSSISGLTSSSATSRAITPDQSLGSFAALTPANPWSTPLQPTSPVSSTQVPSWQSTKPSQPAVSNGGSTIDWSTAAAPTSNVWSTPQQQGSTSNFGAMSKPASSFSIAPPPSLASKPLQPSSLSFGSTSRQPATQVYNVAAAPKPAQPAQGGLSQYESLL